MSHVVEIQTEIRDATAVGAACGRLGLPEPREETAELFSGKATGLAIRLPNWRYPVVCELATGRLCYDNFAGRWGCQEELDRLLQMYAVEKAKLEARRRGLSTTEQALSDGSIKLTVNVAGGAA